MAAASVDMKQHSAGMLVMVIYQLLVSYTCNCLDSYHDGCIHLILYLTEMY